MSGNHDMPIKEALELANTIGRMKSGEMSKTDAIKVIRDAFLKGYQQAMKDAEMEFQQRAIDYVVGCMKTADEVLKRVA